MAIAGPAAAVAVQQHRFGRHGDRTGPASVAARASWEPAGPLSQCGGGWLVNPAHTTAPSLAGVNPAALRILIAQGWRRIFEAAGHRGPGFGDAVTYVSPGSPKSARPVRLVVRHQQWRLFCDSVPGPARRPPPGEELVLAGFEQTSIAPLDEARGLHPDRRHTGVGQPAGKLSEPGERWLERPGLLIEAAATGARHADRRHNLVAMHVETRAPLYDHIHSTAPFGRQLTLSPGGGLPRMSLSFALAAAINGPTGPRATLSHGL